MEASRHTWLSPVHGLRVHMICAADRVHTCYKITAANMADVTLTGELVTEAEFTGSEYYSIHQILGRTVAGDNSTVAAVEVCSKAP